MSDLSLRENQILKERPEFGESVEGTLPPTGDYITTRMAIQDHHAEKAGRHFDIRFLINGKGVSFVTRKGLPTTVGEIRRLVRTPNHRPEYMEWAGQIPKGQYGAGKVDVHDAQDVVLKAEPDKMVFDIHDGPNAGRYAIIKHWNDWFAVKRKDFAREWSERGKYRAIDDPTKIPNYDDYMALQKLDGANFIAQINPHGISFTSAHKSKDGVLISRENSVPHLRDLKLPSRYHGMVVRGELWHPAGFNVLSGILNSKPTNAVIDQQELGKVMFAPFDIERMPDGRSGKDMPYSEKLRILKEIAQKTKNDYISVPQHAVKGKTEFENKILGNALEEGAVYRHMTDPNAPVYKVKNYFDYDLVVSGLVSGEGKFKDKGIGALRLSDSKGNYVGNVGSGLSDELRRDIYKNPDKYLGKIVKVKSMKPLIDKLRAPVFMGISDKTEADMLHKAAASKEEYGEHYPIFTPKNRADIEAIISKAKKSGHIGRSSTMPYATSSRPFANLGRALLGKEPNPMVYMPVSGYPLEERYLNMAGNDRYKPALEDKKDLRQAIIVHELAERARMLMNKEHQKSIAPASMAIAGATAGVISGLRTSLGSPIAEAVSRGSLGFGAGAVVGALINSILRRAGAWKKEDQDEKSLIHMSGRLTSAHMDPDVLIAESNAVVALRNKLVTKAMKIMRGQTYEKSPLSAGTDYRYGNKFIDPTEKGLRHRIYSLYKKEAKDK